MATCKQTTLTWLLEKLNTQIINAQRCLDEYVFHVKRGELTQSNKSRTDLTYWLDRIKNTQRVIEELEAEEL